MPRVRTSSLLDVKRVVCSLMVSHRFEVNDTCACGLSRRQNFRATSSALVDSSFLRPVVTKIFPAHVTERPTE